MFAREVRIQYSKRNTVMMIEDVPHMRQITFFIGAWDEYSNLMEPQSVVS